MLTGHCKLNANACTYKMHVRMHLHTLALFHLHILALFQLHTLALFHVATRHIESQRESNIRIHFCSHAAPPATRAAGAILVLVVALRRQATPSGPGACRQTPPGDRTFSWILVRRGCVGGSVSVYIQTFIHLNYIIYINFA